MHNKIINILRKHKKTKEYLMNGNMMSIRELSKKIGKSQTLTLDFCEDIKNDYELYILVGREESIGNYQIQF